MGFYISLQFLNIFFEKGEQKERFIRYIAFLAFFLFNSVVSLILNWASIGAAVNFHGRNLSDDADVSRKVENQNHSSSFSGRSSSGFRGRILSSFDRTAFGIYHTIDFGGHRFIIFLVYDRCEKDRR